MYTAVISRAIISFPGFPSGSSVSCLQLQLKTYNASHSCQQLNLRVKPNIKIYMFEVNERIKDGRNKSLQNYYVKFLSLLLPSWVYMA